MDSFFLTGPSCLFWIIALLLAEKSITFNFTTVNTSLFTMFFWFCSFNSSSIPGGLSRSHGIPPVHYSFDHNSIPSPAYTTICSAIPQLKGIPSFSRFLPLQRVQLKIFLHKTFSLWSLWGTNPAMVWVDQKAVNFLVLFINSSRFPSRMVGSVHNSTRNALMFHFYHIPSSIHHSPLQSF